MKFLIFHQEGFQLPAPSHCSENASLYSQKKKSAPQGLRVQHTYRIILFMSSANERWRYNVTTSSLIGWAHVQNDPWLTPWLSGLLIPVGVSLDIFWGVRFLSILRCWVSISINLQEKSWKLSVNTKFLYVKLQCWKLGEIFTGPMVLFSALQVLPNINRSK